jgi:peptidyl-dipeptidase Dcp
MRTEIKGVSMSQNNDALRPFETAKNAFESIQFSQIKTEHYVPAVDAALELARKNLVQLRESKEKPTFENTILFMESASDALGLVAGTYFTLLSANGSPADHDLAPEISAKLAAFESDIALDAGIFARIKSLYIDRANLNLDAESLRLLEKSYLEFSRNGALLGDADKEKLRALDQEMSALSPQYSQNLLKATNAYELHLTTEDEIAGLPETALAGAAHEASKRDKKGWVFTLQAPSFVPFLTYCERRDLRENLWRAFTSRAYKGEFDNQDLLKRMVALRHERAALLGYAGHAAYVLEERMAETSETVMTFLDDMHTPSLPAAKKDVERVAALAKTDGIEKLMPWDFALYSERLKKKELGLDDEELRKYFALEPTIKGLFDIANRLYDLSFKECQDVEVYHEDVRVYEVMRQGKSIALFFMDLFPRDTKQGGAWQTTFRDQGLWRGQITRPHVSIVCNFSPPTPGKASLLRHDEVTTLFHEFGHALHSMLSDCKYQSTGGTSVYWDFVELPSQIMENWAQEKDALDLFAVHFETGAKIPAELVEQLSQARQFLAGYGSLRQLNFAYLDMAWHLADPGEIGDVAVFEREVLKKTQILPVVEGAASSPSFAHIFAGGYSSGYYSYKWAEVLEADAFGSFKENGLFDAKTAESFRANVLSRGNSAHPMDLFVNFRGRKPDPEALLKRDGLIS